MSHRYASSPRSPRLLICAGLATLISISAAAHSFLPPQLESRLHDIYDKHDYDVKRFAPVRWMENGEEYVVIESAAGADAKELVRYDPARGVREVLVSASQLAPPDAQEPLALEDFALSKGGASVLVVTNGHVGANGIALADYWMLDREGATLKRLVTDVEEPNAGDAFAPDGKRILYVHGRDLYVKDLVSGATTQLTSDGVVGSIGNGVSEWGPAAARWSPDGQRIVYIQADVRPMGQFPLVNYTEAAYPQVRYQRFPKVGTPITALRVGVVSASGGATQWISMPEEEDGYYIDEIDWAPGSEALVIHKLTRSRDAVDLFLANVNTGAVTSVHREQDSAWVRDSRFANASGFEWIADGKSFIWLGERNGWRHAYTVSRDGSRQTLLSPGATDVISIVKVDEKGAWLYYIASPDNATQRYLYRARLDGTGRTERVTPGNQPGTHSYDISPDARWAIHTYSTADTPPVTALVELPQHRVVRVLEDNAALRAKMKAWGPGPTEFLKLDIGEGVVMDAWMLKPRNFDATKKYPVFVYVYGEPASQTVLDSWPSSGQGHQLFHRALADAGYLVVSIDNRGTPAPKGSAWRRSVFGSLGPLSTEEQAAGLRALARTRPFVDLTRVGIWGWSAGGTNTLNALFRKPDQYHVGIAVVPKPRPELYNAWFQEIFMRTPQENPEGYRLAAPINYADGLQGRLLIITGTGETNTHVQIIEHLVNRLIELGKPFDYMVYPNRNHGMREGAETRPHLYRLISRYLIEHLPPGARQP